MCADAAHCKQLPPSRGGTAPDTPHPFGRGVQHGKLQVRLPLLFELGGVPEADGKGVLCREGRELDVCERALVEASQALVHLQPLAATQAADGLPALGITAESFRAAHHSRGSDVPEQQTMLSTQLE